MFCLPLGYFTELVSFTELAVLSSGGGKVDTVAGVVLMQERCVAATLAAAR